MTCAPSNLVEVECRCGNWYLEHERNVNDPQCENCAWRQSTDEQAAVERGRDERDDDG